MRSQTLLLDQKVAFALVFVTFSFVFVQKGLAQSAAAIDAGLRMELKKGQKFPVISQVWPNSPAAEAGAKVGETIWALDGTTVEGLSVSEIQTRLAGDGDKHSLQIGTEKREIKLKSARLKGKCLTGDCKTGRGTWLEPDGAKYEGDFAAGRFHGKGTMNYASGNRHDGSYIDGKRSGAGKFMFENGTVYEGNFDQNDFEGTGKIRHKNGESYDGDFHADFRQGKGTAFYPNGDRYEGDWADDQKHGIGQMTAADGSYYEGAWLKGRRNGFGKQVSFEGWSYEGNWQNDEKSGFGKQTNALGDRTEGLFSANRPPSSGKVFFADGKKYEGQLFDGKPHGFGRCEISGGHIFEGNFSEGQPKKGLWTTGGGRKSELEVENWAELLAKMGANPMAGKAPAPSVGQSALPRNEQPETAPYLPKTYSKPTENAQKPPVAAVKEPQTIEEYRRALAILEGREAENEQSTGRFLKGSTTSKKRTEEQPPVAYSNDYGTMGNSDFNRNDEPQPNVKRRNASPRTVSDDGLTAEAREALAILNGEDVETSAESTRQKPTKTTVLDRKEAEKRIMPKTGDQNAAEKKRLLTKIDGFFDHVRTSENWLIDNEAMIGPARKDNLLGLSSMASTWAASAANFRESFPMDLKISNRIAAIDATERFLDTNRKLAQNFQRLAFLSAEWVGSKDETKKAELLEIRSAIDALLPVHETRFEAARRAIL